MIPIKIGKKKFNIKSISELTTAEFIELSKIENCDMVKYVAWQTKEPLQDSFFAVTSKVIEIAIGQAPDITKMLKHRRFDYSKTIDTVGQRHQVENSGKTGLELLVYCLAVAQMRSNNSDQIEKAYKYYLDQPFPEILPAGFFFFRNYKRGKVSVLSVLNSLLALIKKLKQKKRLASKG